MCQLCDGASEDELRLELDRLIETYGWALQGVEGTPWSDPWTYTIGLVEHFGHPELIVTSVAFDMACVLLNELSQRVRGGQRFLPGDETDVSGIHVRFVAVHPAQLSEDLFAIWSDHYRAFGAVGPVLTAMQVLLPDSLFCAKHGRAMPRLDQPAPVLGSTRPNRAARRARSSRHRDGGRGRHGRHARRRRHGRR
jgi:hypothetical protein